MDVVDYVSVTALDISANALDRYRALYSEKSLCVLGNIMEMSFKEDSFDGVYNLGVMEHFEQGDMQKVLKELHRVLKPGGKVVLFWPPRTVSDSAASHSLLSQSYLAQEHPTLPKRTNQGYDNQTGEQLAQP
jgi:ubiquinone/menaquinone biosynthesis C-methylase UbiE